MEIEFGDLGREMDFVDVDPAVSNSENLSLADFVKTRGATLLGRAKPFSDYLQVSHRAGLSNFLREVASAPGPEVTVRDPVTGEISSMLMFGSNDYLGFANHPRVKQEVIATIEKFGVGMGGPPLLNGMGSIHRQLEKEIATLKGKGDSLLFTSGYKANVAWVTALVRDGDWILFDELNHASFFDGLKICQSINKNVRAVPIRHNDLDSLRIWLKRAREKKAVDAQIFVVVEGVYSMDGDLAPLPEIVELTKKAPDRDQIVLVVDDAHGTGVHGQNGAGTAERFGLQDHVDLAMGTFSKCFGVNGAFLSARQEIVDYLRFFSRPYMFSAHLPQMTAAAVLAGIRLLREEPEIQERLHRNVRRMTEGFNAMGFKLRPESAILSIVIPEKYDLRALSRRFQERGLFVNSVEFPAVKRSAQRLRISVSAAHTQDHIDSALVISHRIFREFGIL